MKIRLLFLTSLCLCFGARAESPSSIPNPRETNRSSIYDGAHVLSTAEKHRIDNAINALEKKTNAQMMVVTVQNLSGQSIEKWSTDLFRRIGIGRKGKNDGLLFVFAMQERKSRLEVGRGLEKRIPNGRATAILQEQVTPAFRRGAYGQGILNGVQVAADAVQGGARTPAKPASKATARASSSNTSRASSSGVASSGASSGGYASPVAYAAPELDDGGPRSGLLLLGVLAVGGVGGLVYLGTRPRRCPQCNGPMIQTEASDADLNDTERVERRMGSRSFKHCSCTKCGYSDIERKDTMFSGVDRCSRCGNRTARTNRRTLSDSTYDFEGTEEITETCEFPPCGHVERRTRSIPRKVRSSTTTSSSVGGLSSGFSSDSSSSSSSSSSDSSSSSSSSYDGGSSSSYSGGDSGGGGGSSSW